MDHTKCKLLQSNNLLTELVRFKLKIFIPIHCDNQYAIYISKNLVFPNCTKYIEVNYYLIRDYLVKNVIYTPFTLLSQQLIKILTKTISPKVFSTLYNNLGILISMLQFWGKCQITGFSLRDPDQLQILSTLQPYICSCSLLLILSCYFITDLIISRVKL